MITKSLSKSTTIKKIIISFFCLVLASALLLVGAVQEDPLLSLVAKSVGVCMLLILYLQQINFQWEINTDHQPHLLGTSSKSAREGNAS